MKTILEIQKALSDYAEKHGHILEKFDEKYKKELDHLNYDFREKHADFLETIKIPMNFIRYEEINEMTAELVDLKKQISRIEYKRLELERLLDD